MPAATNRRTLGVVRGSISAFQVRRLAQISGLKILPHSAYSVVPLIEFFVIFLPPSFCQKLLVLEFSLQPFGSRPSSYQLSTINSALAPCRPSGGG
jgi:hypothetical protein